MHWRTRNRSFTTFVAGNRAAPLLVQIDNGTFYRLHPSGAPRPHNPPLFPGLTFRLESECQKADGWAVIGPSSSGKTSLLEVLRGQHLVLPPTARSYPYFATLSASESTEPNRSSWRAFQFVGFGSGRGGNLSGSSMKGSYLSARYESRKEATDFSLLDYLQGNTQLNALDREQGGAAMQKHLYRVIQQLRLNDLLAMPVANLSNGQTRRARVAKALVKQPRVLLLDEPFSGLDPINVRLLSDLLRSLTEDSRIHVVLSLRSQDPAPAWITKILRLRADSTIEVPTGPRSEPAQSASSRRNIPDPTLLEAPIPQRAPVPALSPNPPSSPSSPLIQMTNLQLSYGPRRILGHSNNNPSAGLTWTVTRGSRWGLFGPNGSGKTTLISLITSDHPQAYSLPVRVFGRSRLPEVVPGGVGGKGDGVGSREGVSIFDLQARIGHSSPEIHAFFPKRLSIRRALASAWADAFLVKPRIGAAERALVDRLLVLFAEELRGSYSGGKGEGGGGTDGTEQDTQWADNTSFGALSFSAQRVLLFLRAVAKPVDVLILDEAFSGMDARVRQKCMAFLERGEIGLRVDGRGPRSRSRPPAGAHPGLTDRQALICISHAREEVPDSVNRWLCLPEPASGALIRFGEFRRSVASSREEWERVWDGG